MDASGYAGFLLGENIAAGSSHTAADLEDLLMRDPNYPGRGHRVNLLDIGSSTVFREIGVGYVSNAVPISGSATPGVNGLKDFITQDFGTNATGPFVLGVVYDDANANGAYDPGEGLDGVTVMPDSGSFYAVTGAAGGYAFPVAASGAIEVTASGGVLPTPVRTHVVLTGVNVKVDFRPSAATGGDGSNSFVDTDTDGFPDEIETALGTSPNNGGDTPSGGAAAAPLPLVAPHLDIHLDFTAPARDRLTLACRVPLTAAFDANGRTLVVDVGGIVRTYTLDSRGRAAGLSARAFQLKMRRSKGVVVAQNALLTVRLTKDSLAAALADEGLVNGTTHGKTQVSVPAIVLADGGYFTTTTLLRYTAKIGKSGAAK